MPRASGQRAAGRPKKSKSRSATGRRRAAPPVKKAVVEAREGGPRKAFLVAAVGASAGGLAAFSDVLRAIPDDTPIAVVLVQHLARDQPSILPELLSHVTSLSVQVARDLVPLEPRHVYVIPPDAQMTVSDGCLRVRPQGQSRDDSGTVDIFFRSVASEHQDRAVGVVLSGSAHDGAAGIREIKAVGGITIAQSPEEAQVDGMPRAAIATNAVDAVLTAAEIGQYLSRLAAHSFVARDEDAETVAPSEGARLRRTFQLLRQATGVDFSGYKLPTLRRRIERRMALHRLSDLADYEKRLESDPSEVLRLEEDLLIHVTSFFREPASYEALTNAVLPRLVARRDPDLPLRFWVPGCSTGEEAYSVAMLTLEAFGERSGLHHLQVFATDVSETAIDKARAGIYPADIAANVSSERLRRFFTVFDGGYRINKDVRDRCIFARQDLTRDPPFSKLDLVVCRNLLIYLNQETQGRVLDVLYYALREQGVLMLGRSESIGSKADLFHIIDKKAQLYAKKADGGPGSLTMNRPPPRPASVGRAPNSSGGPSTAWDAQSDANRFLLDHYSPPAVIVDAGHRVLRSRGGTGAFLELPSGEVSLDVLKMVHPELLYPLRTLLHEATIGGAPVSKGGLRYKIEGRARTVTLHVVPLRAGTGRQFLILFDNLEGPARRRPAARIAGAKRLGGRPTLALERELEETRTQLQSIIDDLGASNEELQAANEEILSSNEELQSTNEELDTAKEELQSTNEELGTLNDELQTRNEELTLSNGDLVNLLVSVQIPIVIVTRDLRIRRVTPAAEGLFNVIPSDIGRPIGHLKPNLSCPDLEVTIAEVIDAVSAREQRVRSHDGRTFSMQIRPYKSVDNRIEGAVIVLFDVSAAEDQAAALEAALEVARATGETVISTVREPILLLDSDLRVLRPNQAFLDTFAVDARDTEGRYVYDLENGQWNIPALRRLLEEVLPEKRNIEGFVVEHEFPRIGRRRLLVDARRIESGRGERGVIILVVRETTATGPRS
jgi:two-component system CheB/CheR fusion protein